MTSPQTLQAIFDASPDGILVTSEQGVIQLVNRQVNILFGYESSELLDREIEMLVPLRFADRHRVHRKEFIRSPRVREMSGIDLMGLRKDGTEISVEISLSHIEVNDKRLVIAAIRDVTEKKQKANQLRVALQEVEAKNRELEQFAYIASHDLQEPLRTVSGFAMLLEQQYRGVLGEDADQYIRYIREASDRMRNLIKGLLDYSLLGKEGNKHRADLNVLVSQVLSDLSIQIRACQARVESEHLPTVVVYEVAMRELFQNLVSNALKYQHPGTAPRVTIGVRRRKSEWIFSVQDNGIGIDPKYREKIFGIFQRLHARSEYSGTGIGLAHCKKIVDLHGGRIWVEPAGTSGSIFYFTLPNPVA
jgi:PAS domain S-box-containing protein